MNFSLVAISTLVKSNIGEKCLTNILINISTQSLRDYLRLANIYCSTSTKKKTGLIGMIIYGCITNKLNKEYIQDILLKTAKKTLNDSDISIKSLPGYGNAGLKKKDMNICRNDSNKPSINGID